jgi:hypothetical protein
MSKVIIPEENSEGYKLLLKEIESAKSRSELKDIRNALKHLDQRISERERFL